MEVWSTTPCFELAASEAGRLDMTMPFTAKALVVLKVYCELDSPVHRATVEPLAAPQ